MIHEYSRIDPVETADRCFAPPVRHALIKKKHVTRDGKYQ